MRGAQPPCEHLELKTTCCLFVGEILLLNSRRSWFGRAGNERAPAAAVRRAPHRPGGPLLPRGLPWYRTPPPSRSAPRRGV